MVSDRSGSVFDERFRLEKLIGRGATAEVYRAVNIASNAPVAVKIITMQMESGNEPRLRFVREVEVQSLIRHRNVAALYGSGVTKGKEPYLVLELLVGKSLRGEIRSSGAVSALKAASYTWQALQGLAAVHAQGVLHRDLKPANMMLEPSPGPVERLVLIDFGFAALEGGAALTQTGSIVGSLTYMAPERLRAEGADERSDVYAIGAILFEMITGTPPFVSSNDFDLIDRHLKEPAPPTWVNGALSPLDEIVQRALAKQPSQRFASASDMAKELGKLAKSLPTETPT